MAGREVSGYGAALPDLFVGRPWVTVLGRYARLCDGERVGELIDACGGLQIPMRAAAHDSAVAAISHMPLVISAAIVEAVAGGPGEPERADWRAAEALSATGWAGMTRLARGEPVMGGIEKAALLGGEHARVDPEGRHRGEEDAEHREQRDAAPAPHDGPPMAPPYGEDVSCWAAR